MRTIQRNEENGAAGGRGLKKRLLPAAALALLSLCGACGKGAKAAPQKHYAVTGKVVSVNVKERSAAIDAAAIANFMEAMTMDYPVKSQAELEALRPGERITGILDVNEDGSYTLTNIKEQPAEKK